MLLKKQYLRLPIKDWSVAEQTLGRHCSEPLKAIAIRGYSFWLERA